MNSLKKWKQRFCDTCPVFKQCNRTNLEILNCALSKLTQVNEIKNIKRERENNDNKCRVHSIN
jgi:hypothetical protein